MTPEEFRSSPEKRITLLGMSGVGKTRLSSLLPREEWYHYSGDYRIGSHYLDEPILDNIKRKMMHTPFLRNLLRSDSIHINNNISFDNLHPVSSFLGKLGDPEMGGLSLTEFQHRQQLHHDAEVATMMDVPHFIDKSRVVYDYPHFINDAGGSLCELNSPQVMEVLSEHTLILYIRATRSDRERLIERAISDPKPLYFPPDFLLQRLDQYRQLKQIDYVAMIDPDDFSRWVFPLLFESRIPRYDAIAAQYGYTISSEEVFELHTEDDFMQLVEHALRREKH